MNWFWEVIAWLATIICEVTCYTDVKTPVATLMINTTSPVHVTDRRYLSFGMDSNLIRDHWETFDFNSKRLQTLAKALSPAYLRLMGTDGDRMIFKVNPKETNDIQGFPFPNSNFTMSMDDWDNINQFTSNVEWRLMFGLNAQLRNGSLLHSSWNASNAIELLTYSAKMGYASNIDFELGNEPDLYPNHKNMFPVSAKQLGKDFRKLRYILDGRFREYFSNSSLIGPAVGYGFANAYITDFVESAGDVITAVTWHHYYGGGNLKYVNNYTDPKILDSYIPVATNAVNVVRNSSKPHLKVWQGETSSTYAPPGSDICETYVAGFMLLDKMGLSARLGMDLVVRQTFYGFWFALVNEDLMPRPNYWLALLYKQLVGSEVLDVTVLLDGKATRYIRMYAHCTASTAMYPKGAITIYGMNLLGNGVDITLDTMLRHRYVDQYLLTSPKWEYGLTSPLVSLNGQVLQMINDTTLPKLKPVRVDASKEILIPPKALVYYVIADAQAAACQ